MTTPHRPTTPVYAKFCETCDDTGYTPAWRTPTLYDPDDGSDPCEFCPARCPHCETIVGEQPEPLEFDYRQAGVAGNKEVSRPFCADARCLAILIDDHLPDAERASNMRWMAELVTEEWGTPVQRKAVAEALANEWGRVAKEQAA